MTTNTMATKDHKTPHVAIRTAVEVSCILSGNAVNTQEVREGMMFHPRPTFSVSATQEMQNTQQMTWR